MMNRKIVSFITIGSILLNWSVHDVVSQASTVSTSVQTPTTTVRPTLSTSSVLRTFWAKLGLQVDVSVDVNTTAYRNNLEDRLLTAYNQALAIQVANNQAGRRRKKRAAVSGNVSLQVVSVTRVGSTNVVNATFLVQQAGTYVAASQVASTMALLSKERLSILLNIPVLSAVSVFDTTLITPADNRAWIIGAVLGTLGAIVLIVWVVLFVYARCLRPQPPPLIDVETPSEVEFKTPVVNRRITYAEPGMDGGVGDTTRSDEKSPMRTPRENKMDDEVNNLDITLLADAVARRLDKKVAKIVDRKLDSRTESMRDKQSKSSADNGQFESSPNIRRAVLLSPSEEDSIAEDSTNGRPPRHGRRRRSKINSISPSEDDSLYLPPLRRPNPAEDLYEEDQEEERKKRRRARQKVARDLDRALGEDGGDKKKAKSRRRRRSREKDKEMNEETLKETRNKMSELLSEPYPVTGSSGDVIEAKISDRLESNPNAPNYEDGELLKPLPVAPDVGHKPIRVLTSLRPEALHTASLSSALKTSDEMEKIRPQMEKDMEAHSETLLDIRGSTPVYIRSPVPGSGDARSTPQGAFRPVAVASNDRHPGAPVSPDADEADIAATTDPATPKPLIDSIRAELERLTATNASEV